MRCCALNLFVSLLLYTLDISLEVEVARALAAADTSATVATEPVDVVKAAIRQGIAETRPLLVWVGAHDPLIEQTLRALIIGTGHQGAAHACFTQQRNRVFSRQGLARIVAIVHMRIENG